MSELTRKRIARFRSLKRARVSLCIFVAMLFFAMTAELWSNNRPLIMSVDGQIYAPVFRDNHPSVFKQEGFITDYRKLNVDWAVWPAIRWSPEEANPSVTTYPSPPTHENWLGTDDRGRDVLSRLIYGFRYSIFFAGLVWFFSFALGTLAGAVMGYFGGRTDLIGQRFVEIFDSLPYVLVLLTLIALLGANLVLLVGVAVLLGWMRISLYMRAEFLKLRNREFVDAGRAQGIGTFGILFRHILPNAVGPLVTFSPPEIAANIYTLAILDYLGLGMPAPTPSWGELLQQANNSFTIAWWLALYPSLAMIVALTTLTFIGEGLRNAFDPRATSSEIV